MSAGKTQSTKVIVLPLWQVILILVGLPALYIGNSLLPWAIGLLKNHDHSFFFEFWTLIVVLHWSSAALVIILLKRVGVCLKDIGLNLSPRNIAAIIGTPLVVGLGLIIFRATSSTYTTPQASAVLPASTSERLFWIFMSFTAGFCEELIYRGFLIRALQGRNTPTWLAVILASLAFFFMHGISALALTPFLTLFISGLLFSALYLWRWSLVPGICLHSLIDVANIAAG